MQMANRMLRWAATLTFAAFASLALAEDVSVVGLFGNKAVLVIDGGPPRTVEVGQQVGRIKLIEVGKDSATVDINGRRSRLGLNEAVSVGPTSGAEHQVTIVADIRGHFLTSGTINGAGVQFMVDTGATSVAMDRATARRAGIDLGRGEAGVAGTAGGVVPTVRVKLAKISVGEVTLYDVEATVLQTPMPYVLLGMSFLNRMEMRRDGSTMVLIQRY